MEVLFLGFAYQLIKFQQKENPTVDLEPFRVQYLRSFYGFGPEDSDSSIAKALRENNFDFKLASETLVRQNPDRKLSLFTVY